MGTASQEIAKDYDFEAIAKIAGICASPLL